MVTKPFHIVPVSDLREHCEDDAGRCWCHPTVKRHGRGLVIMHQSADGRELVEQHGVN